MFGGQEQNFKFKDNYIYDTDLNTVVKDDAKLRKADFFEHSPFIVNGRSEIYAVGGYYVHVYHKILRAWIIQKRSLFHKYKKLHKLVTPDDNNSTTDEFYF